MCWGVRGGEGVRGVEKCGGRCGKVCWERCTGSMGIGVGK